MTADEFLGSARRFVDAWNRHDLDALGALYAEGIVRYTFGERVEGKDALRRDRQPILRAFPDLSLSYQHQFLAGTHGVVRWTIRGTQTGPLEMSSGTIPATGKRVEFAGASIWELNDKGLIVREWVYPDMLGLLQQLGAIKIAVAV